MNYHTQTTKDAIKFYHGKVDDLGKNLVELEKVIGGKSDNVRIVEDGELAHSCSNHPTSIHQTSLTLPPKVLRQKVMQGEMAAGPSGAG